MFIQTRHQKSRLKQISLPRVQPTAYMYMYVGCGN